MNIITSVYKDEESLLDKTKKITKRSMKIGIYACFLSVGVMAAMHLYANQKDRQLFVKSVNSMGSALGAKMNDSSFRMTGHTLSEYIGRTTKFTGHVATDVVHTSTELITNNSNKMSDQKFNEGVVKSEKMLLAEFNKNSPKLASVIQKDATQSAKYAEKKIKEEIKHLRNNAYNTKKDIGFVNKP